jgi:Amt family ammonium transporter
MHSTPRSWKNIAAPFVPLGLALSAASAWADETVGAATAAVAAASAPSATVVPIINSGDTAWVLVSAALVMLMTPGLGLFYGGMVRRKNVLSTIMQSFFLVALIGVQWVIYGYSLSFSPGNDFLGSFHWAFLNNLGATNPLAPTIPHQAFMIYQAMFAIITPALISGAFAERIKFKGYVVFMLAWATLVYNPVCHWVWGGGFFTKMGALDFAGGTVVHMTAGYSALVLALFLGKRKGYGIENMVPHNMTMVLIGASLLWFGWFGFNAGSALGANALAASAFVATNTAAAMATLSWALIEYLHRGKASALGAASGAVAGLVAITPAAGYVDLSGALWIGLLVSPICYFFVVVIKQKFGYDDSLDAFGVHGVGGTFGALATGLWANPSVNSAKGLFYGNPGQFVIQLKTVIATMAYSVVVTLVLAFLVEKLVGFRAKDREEEIGLDLSQHGEAGYTI